MRLNQKTAPSNCCPGHEYRDLRTNSTPASCSSARIGPGARNRARATVTTTDPQLPRRSAPSVGTARPQGAGSRLITGASDDDPSGIGTYSQAGAQFGFGIAWTMLLTYPLMAAIQEISARIGRTTGHGIAGNLCRHYPSWLLYGVVTLLFIANTINIGADLSAMANAIRLLIGGPAAAVCRSAWDNPAWSAIVFMTYERYVWLLKWMTLSLFAYVAALFAIKIPWGEALFGALVPRIIWSQRSSSRLCLRSSGPPLSPYLFFWQASQEAEDQRVNRRERAAGQGAASGA